jgi:pimeloyl-ACP methyl ester carboxylesterase
MPLGDCSNDSVFAISTTEMSNSRIEPFEINIPLEEVDRLKRKLKDTRLPPREIVPNAGDKYGPTYEWGNNLYDTWLNDFDWYEHQKRMASAPSFIYTHPEGIKIHFVHAQSKRKDAISLMMAHGWPGSFYEFNQVWSPLSNPEDEKRPAFHVVVPSLPGYGFSDWPSKAGWTLQDTARIFNDLMLELGYKQ